jgi:peptidoglycan/xylan/chitin deacetylase (PgdA/CDA1 family)
VTIITGGLNPDQSNQPKCNHAIISVYSKQNSYFWREGNAFPAKRYPKISNRMKPQITIILLFFIGTGCFGQPKKQMAVTMDDLPITSKYPVSDGQQMAMTIKILEALKKHHAPAIGFVNEYRLNRNGEIDSARVKILDTWCKYGMSLGNHTKNHIDYNTNALAVYAKNIIDGELVTKQVLEKNGQHIKYFRHPYLHRGNSKEKADSLMVFLKEHRYTEAPVTIDNSDWIFSAAYDSLAGIYDSAGMANLGKEYVNYMENKLMFYESQCNIIFKRQIRQTLILHANLINADYLDQLLSTYANHNYTFITLDEALKDKVYKSPDTFYKGAGISWIHRWAITKKVNKTIFAGEPATPPYVMKLAKAESE